MTSKVVVDFKEHAQSSPARKLAVDRAGTKKTPDVIIGGSRVVTRADGAQFAPLPTKTAAYLRIHQRRTDVLPPRPAESYQQFIG